MILLIANSQDPTGKVIEILEGYGKRVVRFNTDQCLIGEVMGFDACRDAAHAYLMINGNRVNIDEAEAVWYLKPLLPKALRTYEPAEYRQFIQNQFQGLWHSIGSLLADRVWISPYANVRRAENKPLQLTFASKLGFQIPETLISSEPERIQAFWENHGQDVVVKTLAGAPIDDKVIFTSALTPEKMRSIGRAKGSPAIYQRRIVKAYELRITVVGDKVFTARIDSQSHERNQLDWRRRNPELKVHAATIPIQIEERCLKMLELLGLRFGCFDFVVTPEGDYVFLEVNPNGQWAWFEAATGLPLSQEIALLLAGKK